MRILLVEDDRDLAPVLARGLRDAAYAVDVATGCAQATNLIDVNAYDVACVDLGLPDGDGLDLVRRLVRERSAERPGRILIVTARDAVEDRVAGLDAGADDYLVKPFAFAELLARLRALARRGEVRAARLEVGELAMELDSQQAWAGGTPLDLTPREFALLRYFMHHPGRVIGAEELLAHVWDRNADPFSSSPRTILSRLRRKLGDPPPIQTITGVGYRLR